MNTTFAISFLARASVELADNEKVSMWEPTRAGSLRLAEKAIQLEGKWRVSGIGNFLGGGLLGELLIKPFFLQDRSETIPFQVLDRIVIYRKKEKITFHLFQSREQGMIEVHVFTANKNILSELLESLKSNIPADLFKEEVRN